MKITEASYSDFPQKGLHLMVDDQPAIIKPGRKSLLDRGVAVLTDIEGAVFPWVNNLAYHLDGDVTNLEPANEIVGGTTDPVVVCLARRYWQALHEGRAKPGRVPIPTMLEALDELENSPFWTSPEKIHVAALA